ncbi:H-NS family nucleoid-associated regulatory protein [Aquabacterium humicola]|uniref:H-NS family nucleoid-associated regulatory protein n=1 Tax=Aquabacterium humicola TaxID=3237377 RepID=UPI0025426F08|nr:H-NS family nucleoid-associated regulatory protein [Rubrivivax pictus]
MKQTYSEITAEIARLQARAESLRKAEVSGVIARIREAINVYGLTAADLGLTASTAKASAPAKAPPASGKIRTGVPKYRDPDSGQTWTGRGKPPLWIKDAKDRTAFLIDGSASPASSPPTPGRKRTPRGKAAKASTVGVAKYRDAETGKTWTGRGKPPAWIAGVKDRSAYLIDGSAA